MAIHSYEDLLNENQQLRQVAEQQQDLIRKQQEQIRQLQQRLADAERSGKRQAAPFSKKPPKDNPKKPGRKSGKKHGKHAHRPPPPEEDIGDTLHATLPSLCTDCGQDVIETHTDVQFQTELPRLPERRKFIIHCGRCSVCGKKFRGRHPQQTSDATGAAASQLGPMAQATVAYLNKHAGMSHGKISQFFAAVHGITLTPGASAQIVLRAGKRLKPAYQEIQKRLAASDHITPDESGWRVGGHPAWLHAWVGDGGVTCFVIDPHRSADALERVIGSDWSGNMTHDGYSTYDRFEEAGHQQCVDNVLRRAKSLVEKQPGRAKVLPAQVVSLFHEALAVRDQVKDGKLDEEASFVAHEDFTARLLDLADRDYRNDENRKLAKHLYNYGEKWFSFLIDADRPATNHRAEQALKTPIVNRKVWGGNRTNNGARAQEVTSSVLQTCKNRAIEVVSYISNALCGTVASLFAKPSAVAAK
jgi:transposase